MQFGFMAGRGTTNVIFMLNQLQGKYSAKKEGFVLHICRFGESQEGVS